MKFLGLDTLYVWQFYIDAALYYCDRLVGATPRDFLEVQIVEAQLSD
jgi:hypothetical protein